VNSLNWPHDAFVVPDNILSAWREAGARGAAVSAAWKAKFDTLDEETKSDFNRRINKDLPEGLTGSHQSI
jgi:transketolase